MELAAAATEQSNPRSAALDALSTSDLIDLFVTEEDAVAAALATCRGSLITAVEITSAALLNGGRLFTSARERAGDLAFSTPARSRQRLVRRPNWCRAIIAGGATALHRAVEGAEDQPEGGALAILERGVRRGDIVCGITASGRTPFVLGALTRARRVGARTILITCNPQRRRGSEEWDAEIDLPTGAEIVTGSTRLKAGTATKVALNILSTCAMVRMGKVRGNSMIDLNISNAKLRDRGVRLVSKTLGISYSEAQSRLEAAAWNVSYLSFFGRPLLAIVARFAHSPTSRRRPSEPRSKQIPSENGFFFRCAAPLAPSLLLSRAFGNERQIRNRGTQPDQMGLPCGPGEVRMAG
jgi:N-acetylmuramic acid 6-phosphate etherase